ncbi:flagellar basal body rod protein FlgB [Paraburkholderia sp. SIMBA_053]|uniref:flagellar basal body rod protein FlgB n=1 Tax=Paraburkholderia sp. SIMBA_053 TaxID=3085794 RepID=UPI00397BBA28
MLDKIDAAFEFDKQALNVRAYRQELLSSNIANSDTPGYQARDVEFSSALAHSLQGRSPTASLNTSSVLPLTSAATVTTQGGVTLTQHGHMQGNVKLVATGGLADAYGPVLYRTPVQPSLDGNTVDLDIERVQFADNSLHFESLITDVSGQIKSLLAAITSGGS